MSTNIDRSLDEIIKEQRKLKKKANQSSKPQKGQKKAKQQKQPQKRKLQGKAAIQQGRRKAVGKQGGQSAQQRRQASQNYGKNKTVGNRAKPGRARVLANRLKSKQGSLQKSKQVISKAKQIQMGRRTKNRQTWQTQQNDARQSIINKKRGLQGTRLQKGYQNLKGLNKQQLITNRQRRNRNINTAPQMTLSISSSGVSISRNPRWKQNSNRREGQNRRRQLQGQITGRTKSDMTTQDLRISIPNNLHQPLSPVKPFPFSYDQRVNCALGTTSTTLNERFSNATRRGVRTIVVD